MSLEYNKKNIVLAKNLRKSATREEKHLWYDFLSRYEVRFQRQKAIGDYIVDFYCHDVKLAVELDGSQHYTEKGVFEDELRTKVLERYGVKVVRIKNKQIKTNFRGVCRYIDRVVQEALQGGSIK